MRWRVTSGKKSVIFARLLVSALAGWIASSALYVAGVALGIHISSTLLLLTAFGTAVMVALFSDFIAISLAKYILSLIANDVEDISKPESGTRVEDIEDQFLIKSFIKMLVEPAIPDIVDVKIVIEGDNNSLDDLMLDPMLLEELEELLPTAVDGWGYVTAIYYTNGNLIVMLDPQVARLLMNTIERGDDEKVVITRNEELVQIYDIVKRAYLTRYPSADGTMAAYIAYKTIKQLINNGLIEVPKELVSNMPYEPEEIRVKVLEQIREENTH